MTAFSTRLGNLLDNEEGTTLIETSIASGILLVTLAGLLSMGSIATMHTENQGHLAPRTTEYAQDKMEQLLALSYTDGTSNTVTFPASAAGGSGLTVGGSTTAPTNLYVDWLAQDGSLLGGGTSAPANWFYRRTWAITQPTATIKQLSVAVTVRSGANGFMAATSTVVALKAAQF